MLWGFVAEWVQDPFDPSRARPFNARAETIREKQFFKNSWRHKRCLLPASGFFERGYRIRRKDCKPFWLAGIWNRWMGPEGSELETCCVITTQSNQLMKPLHNRMPAIIPHGLEETWIAPQKTEQELKTLQPLLNEWSAENWVAESTKVSTTNQMSLF
ncbi:hypothetical protein EV05_0027 [Prochlorococcus sp. MIT 0601]|nr:hypothetical protein EV05_0027 [Prochlorococcus sp. MIT 0601]